MNIDKIGTVGTTDVRKRFWDSARDTVMSLQKLEGKNVSVQEFPGKGTIINVDRKERPEEATGACCIDGVCSTLTESACGEAGGTYHGDGTPCDPNPCVCLCFPSQIIFTFTFEFDIDADCPFATCSAWSGSATITKTYTRVDDDPTEDGQFRVNPDCTIDIFDSGNFFIVPTDVQDQVCEVAGASSMGLSFPGHFFESSGVGNAFVVCEGFCSLSTGDIIFPAINWCANGTYTSVQHQEDEEACARWTATLTLDIT